MCEYSALEYEGASCVIYSSLCVHCHCIICGEKDKQTGTHTTMLLAARF